MIKNGIELAHSKVPSVHEKRQAERREDFLKRLHALFLKDPKSMQEFAADIGISYTTFVAFMNGTRKTNFKEMLQIEHYIVRTENGLPVDRPKKGIMK